MKVVIVGAGLGGAEAAKALAGTNASVTVIDRQREQSFQPLLPQVASGAVPSEAATTRFNHAGFLQAEVATVDAAAREVVLKDGTRVAYDYLIIAAGATVQAPPHTLPLKSVADAERIQRRFLDAFAAADSEPDPGAKKRLLSFVVVGGGPTGVELAGSLGELVHELLAKYPRVKASDVDLRLVHGGERLLPEFSEKGSDYAQETLRGLGVRVQLQTRLDSVAADHAVIGGKRVETSFVAFAGGLKGAARDFGLAAHDPRGRLSVDEDLSVRGQKNVFVVGDAAASESKGKEVPSVAPAAIQGGAHAAAMIAADLAGAPRQPFKYVDKGSAVQITRAAGVVEAMGMTLTGSVASKSIMGLHAMLSPHRDLGAKASLFSAMAGFAPRTGLLEVDNDFTAKTVGSLSPAGSILGRAKQAALISTLAAAAAGPRLGDVVPRTLLRGLSEMPPIDAQSVERHSYRSRVTAAPAAVFAAAAKRLPELFAASGLTVHKGANDRLMLEDPGPPPLWMPIQARIDHARRTIDIVTLDGHPLRGTNAFRFADDGKGGTIVEQETVCQASSELSGIGARLFGSDRQAAAWREFHAYLYRLFPASS